MKTSKFIFSLAAIILLLSALAFAQDKDKIEPMPATASLTESQAWLVKALNKNFGYNTYEDTVKISDLKFEGCKISYRMHQKYVDQKASLGDRPALGQTGAGAQGAKDVPYTVYEHVWFDLKDIDAARIGLGPLPKPKAMQLISLETLNKKDTVNFDRKGSYVQYNAKGARALAALPVKEKAGEAIAKGFMQVIRLCQLPTAK